MYIIIQLITTLGGFVVNILKFRVPLEDSYSYSIYRHLPGWYNKMILRQLGYHNIV